MAKKIYGIVLNDGTNKIIESWADAKAFIATNPSNAKYKGFKTLDEAQNFINETLNPAETKAAPAETSSIPEKQTAIAYVDGSFNVATNTWGWGAIIADKATPNNMLSLNGSGTSFAKMRNVTGELTATVNAIKKVIEMGFKSIEIYHDYTGIAEWAEHRWSANNKLTQHYQECIKTLKQRIDIKFIKVDAHTGVKLNELADTLAKKSCGI